MKDFVLNPVRVLPDGSVRKVFPFHVSIEGSSVRIFCRCDDDYDTFVKCICVSARRKNVILVNYAVVSNHAHAVILASCREDALSFSEEVKKMYSMFYSRKYGDRSMMKHLSAKPIWIDSDWYLRNSLAYDIRNALDNSASVEDYRWTGFRAFFRDGGFDGPSREVRSLSKRERRRIMRTDDDLSDVPWLLDGDESLIPVSFLDWSYVESAYSHDYAFFMRTIGSVNTAEMKQKLVLGPKKRQNDSEFFRSVSDLSERWFKSAVHDLPVDKKARLMSYVWNSLLTSPSQLGRVFELPETVVRELLHIRSKS